MPEIQILFKYFKAEKKYFLIYNSYKERKEKKKVN